ncbi:hypothetical protein ACCS45_03915 [Rhizobium ruizarguesonis]
MRLNYNVLVIDDDLDSVRRVQSEFSELNLKMGILVEYTTINARAGSRSNREQYVARMEREIKDAFDERTFDLIMIDLHLDMEVEGHLLIKFIRDHHTIYRPVIFYSAGNPSTQEQAESQLATAARENGLLGRNILTTPRGSAMARLLSDIASEMHREEHRVNQVRGMLMDQMSELDAKIIKALKNEKVWEGTKEGSEAKLFKFIQEEIVEDRLNSAKKLHGKLKASDFDTSRELVLEHLHSLDVSARTRLLKKILSLTEGMETNAAALHKFVSNTGLNGVRNNYAHRTIEMLRAEHDDAKCIAIRTDTREQMTNVAAILRAYE